MTSNFNLFHIVTLFLHRVILLLLFLFTHLFHLLHLRHVGMFLKKKKRVFLCGVFIQTIEGSKSGTTIVSTATIR